MTNLQLLLTRRELCIFPNTLNTIRSSKSARAFTLPTSARWNWGTGFVF